MNFGFSMTPVGHTSNSPNLFRILDNHEPADWISQFGEDGERYAYPTLLNKPGFFEDFFDGQPKAVETFWRVVNRPPRHCQRGCIA